MPDAAEDRALLRRAIQASGARSARQYARTVAGINEVTVRRQLQGQLPLQGTARQLARAIVAMPEIVKAIRIEPKER